MIDAAYFLIVNYISIITIRFALVYFALGYFDIVTAFSHKLFLHIFYLHIDSRLGIPLVSGTIFLFDACVIITLVRILILHLPAIIIAIFTGCEAQRKSHACNQKTFFFKLMNFLYF